MADETQFLLDTVGLVYSAAHQPEQWEAALAGLSAAACADAAAILFIDHREASVGFASTHRISAHDLERYRSRYVSCDPLSPTLLGHPVGKLTTNDRVITTRSFVRTEYYESYLEPLSFQHLAGGAFRRDSSRIGQTVFMRSNRSATFDAARLDLVERLMPHVDASFRMFERLSRTHSGSQDVRERIESAPDAMLICDRSGRVLVQNNAASGLIARYGGLSIKDGVLGAAYPGDEPRLADGVHRAALDPVSCPAPVSQLHLKDERGGLEVRIQPAAIELWQQTLWTTETTVALLLSPPATRPLGSTATRHLTKRQARVAQLAVTGATVEDMARMLSVSPNTVRFHLKAIYRVLGVGSRVELFEALFSDGP